MSKRSYKRGVADTMHAFAEFEKKQADAIKYVRENFVKKLEGHLTDITEYITEQERNALYKFCVPTDIRQLSEHDKIFAVGILYVLANDKAPNENQKKYIQTLQKYLEVREYPLGIDVSVIEDIDSISVQKVLFQIVIEYLILQNSDVYDETDVQNDLLDSFSISKKSKGEIIEKIEFVQKILGDSGIVQKYDTADINADKKEKLGTEMDKVIENVKQLHIERLYLPTNVYSSDIVAEDFSSKARCLNTAKAELKKVYNSAKEYFEPYSNQNLAAVAFERIMRLRGATFEKIRHSISMFPKDIGNSKDVADELLETADIEAFKKNLKSMLKEELILLNTQDEFASIDFYMSKIELISFNEEGGLWSALTSTTWTCVGFPEHEIYEAALRLVGLYEIAVSRNLDTMIDNIVNKIEETVNKVCFK